ncbi:MAG: PDZ domain-containing protein, partial [Desulfobulbaceae bacterium]|nr:PDZ domain-containing protein [Candidatus Desulfatifera sulfidica]
GAGLIIRELSPQGKAKEAGVKEGEIILAIDNYPVRDMNDLRIAMLDARVGERLQITLQMKNGKPVERIVELSSLETIKPHP